MNPPRTLHLPVFQRFDCQGCGHCCRYPVANVSESERNKILLAGWADRLSGIPLFVSYRLGGRRFHRLAKQPDGRCIFLGDDGRCRLHADTGIETKPLVCRLFPFNPLPSVNGLHLDLRFDCPSVAANHGRPITEHRRDIIHLADNLKIPTTIEPPVWPGQRRLRPAEFVALVDRIEKLLTDGDRPVRVRWRTIGYLLDLLYNIRIKKLDERRFIELLDLLAVAAREEGPHEPARTRPPKRAHRLFRQWLFLHCLHDESEVLDLPRWARFRCSWKRYFLARQFARATDAVPKLLHDWPNTDFSTLSQIQSAPEAALEPLVRAMRVKLVAHAFTGPAYFNYDLLAGLTAWSLLPALVGFAARLSAVVAGRNLLTHEDILDGTRKIHLTFGVSPVFAHLSERLRLRALMHPGISSETRGEYAL